MIELINSVITRFWVRLVNFLPDFFGGLLILIAGFIVAGIIRKLIITLLIFLRVDTLLQKARLLARNQVKLWEEIIAEIAKWTIVILFLVPTLEIWGLSKATVVLNQFLFYLPNVLVAVIIGFVGIVVANLVADLVKHSITTTGATSAAAMAVAAKSTVLFFTALIVLNQLGVAQDLIRILFTGIVAMLALAGGLAFGLGGRDLAKEILEELKKKFK
ncbi:MAG: mechanosensitive ion channel family protein [Microgenomates group bacterium]